MYIYVQCILWVHSSFCWTAQSNTRAILPHGFSHQPFILMSGLSHKAVMFMGSHNLKTMRSQQTTWKTVTRPWFGIGLKGSSRRYKTPKTLQVLPQGSVRVHLQLWASSCKWWTTWTPDIDRTVLPELSMAMGGIPSHHPFRTMGFSWKNHPAIKGAPPHDELETFRFSF